MEWKTAVSELRKRFKNTLASAGFDYVGQGQWRRPMGAWSGLITLEVSSRKKGASRNVYCGVSLTKRVQLTPEEAGAARAILLPNTTTFAVYNHKFPAEVEPTFDADSPEEFLKYGQELIDDFHSLWLPWMLAKSEEIGDSTQGAWRYLESVRSR